MSLVHCSHQHTAPPTGETKLATTCAIITDNLCDEKYDAVTGHPPFVSCEEHATETATSIKAIPLNVCECNSNDSYRDNDVVLAGVRVLLLAT
jgi:hypothetical protein